jgi:hypothetical protein
VSGRTGRRGDAGKGRPSARAAGSGRAAGKARVAGAKKPAPTTRRESSAPAAPAGPFRLGAIPGATPGKWIDVWQERMPRHPLELLPLAVVAQRAALVAGDVDAALVRLPIVGEGLHVIPLYEEVAVVVCARDSHLTAADELTTADLAGEVLITPRDDVLGFTAETTVAPRFAPPETTEDAIATVATGVGITVVPMSLARLHHRKDIDVRPLVDAPTSPVALAWVAERTDPLIDTFVGIVRGRSARSSRS